MEFIRVSTNGVQLSCASAGPVDGPLVVLLHGFPECWFAWRGHIERLAAAGYRVLAPDQRGYGRSDRPSRVADYRMDLLSADIAGLIVSQGRSQAQLVGHDWGGAVAWWLAATRPELVSRLVVMNVPHPLVMRRHLLRDPKQMRRSWYFFAFQMPRLPERTILRKGGRPLYAGLREFSAPESFGEAEWPRYQNAWSQPGAAKGMLNWYRAALRHPPSLAEGQEQVRVPTLILWGRKDHVLREQMAVESLDRCDDASLRLFEDAGHFVQHDARAEVQRELLAFLTMSEGGGASGNKPASAAV